MKRRHGRLGRTVGVGLAVLAIASGRVGAHAGSIEAATSTPPVPTWFVVLTAGVVVGSSFLFTSLMADHEALVWVNGLGLRGGVPARAVELGTRIIQGLAVLALAGVVGVGVLGPSNPQANAATLLVWVGWWGGFTMTTYLLGNAWPVVNPFRALASLLPDRPWFDYPERFGVWPAAAGVLLIVWLEVSTAVSANPAWLAGVVVGYVLVTALGIVALGRELWFERVDPLTRIFRVYGHLAPVQRTADGIELRLPAAALTDRPTTSIPGVPAFVVALLWSTTFDGLVSIPAFQAVATPVIRAGVPAPLLYLLVLVAGFWLFYAVYRLACRYSRTAADTYVTAGAIERWFAPSLIPIAAGYHLAHFLGYVVTLSPALVDALQAPLAAPPTVTLLLLPDWFGLVQLSFVLVGHLIAIWVAHSLAFELFPGVRQPIRSQYPMILVMIAYTMVSAWVIVSPATAVVLG